MAIKMNHAQRKYAMERVERICKIKHNRIEEKHTTKSKNLTKREQVALVRRGKVNLKSDLKINFDGCYFELCRVYDFSKHEIEGGLNRKKADAEYDPIRKKAQEIQDTLMLGDSEEALKMIQNFEK